MILPLMLWVSLVWTFDFYLNLPHHTVTQERQEQQNKFYDNYSYNFFTTTTYNTYYIMYILFFPVYSVRTLVEEISE